MQSYLLSAAASVEYAEGGVPIRHSFKAGTVTPKTPTEAVALERLVADGIATRAQATDVADATPTAPKEKI